MAAKHPEPFWRKQSNCYYVQIGPKQIRLAKDKAEAYRLYHELMARRPDEPQPSPQPYTLAAVSLIDEFVEWTRINRERPTFEAYKRRLGLPGRSHFVHAAMHRPASLPPDTRDGRKGLESRGQRKLAC